MPGELIVPAMEAGAAFGGVRGLGGMLARLLGPSADEAGSAMARWTANRFENVGKIAAKAEAKLGDAINHDGEIHPRVVVKTLEDASWSDDDVVQEYAAGVLAAARTSDRADDRAVYWADLVSSLAAYQVRTHFAIYKEMKRLLKPGTDLSMDAGRNSVILWMPIDVYSAAMEIADVVSISGIAVSCMGVLNRESLIAAYYVGMAEQLPIAQLMVDGARGFGLAVQANLAGFELFLWAHGYIADGPTAFARIPVEDFDPKGPQIQIPAGSILR